MAPSPTVTLVTATYDRPDALAAAVRSVLAQTFGDWALLVVGDGCDGRTADRLREFDDPRIRYVNLPERFGEQAGPNSLGLAAARSETLALLNHDDVLLPDHLERALAALDGAGADLFVGRAAKARRCRETADGVFPEFSTPRPPRRLAQAFHESHDLFEPASAWVFRAGLARDLGRWRLARECWRPPAQDWLVRAWRRGTRVVFGDVVTVLHLVTHYRRKREDGCYAAASPEHDALGRWLGTSPPDELRKEIAAAAVPDEDPERRGLLHQPLRTLLVNRATGLLYRATGLDANTLWCRLSGKGRGHLLRRVTVRRTGRDLPEPPEIDRMLPLVRAALEGARA